MNARRAEPAAGDPVQDPSVDPSLPPVGAPPGQVPAGDWPDADADADAEASAEADANARRRGPQYPPRPTDGVSDIIRNAGRTAWAIVGIALALAVIIYIGARISVIFPPLVLAGMIVFILNPLVTFLERRRVPRAAGTGIAYLGFFSVVSLLVVLAVPAIQDQARELADHWPEVQDRIETWIDDRAADLEGTPFEFNREDIVDRFGNDSEIDVGESVQRATEIGFQILEVLLIFILAPIFAFYILVDLPHLRRVTEGLIPPAAREDVVLVSRRLNHALGGFFRGQMVVAMIVGAMSSVGLWIIDLPFWLIIGMIAGFFNLIPLIGPWVGGIPAVFIALTSAEPITAVWAALVLLIVQQIDNHFISPLVMQRAVKLHPVVVMVTLLLGGSLFGFFGLLVAVPLTAAIKIVGGHLWRVRVLGQTPEEWYIESEATDEVSGVGVIEDVPVDDAVARRGLLRRRAPAETASPGMAPPAGTDDEPRTTGS